MNVMQGGIKAPAAGRLFTPRFDKLSLSPKLAGDFGQPSVGTRAVRIDIPSGFPESTHFSGKSDLPRPHAPSLCPRVLFILPQTRFEGANLIRPAHTSADRISLTFP